MTNPNINPPVVDSKKPKAPRKRKSPRVESVEYVEELFDTSSSGGLGDPVEVVELKEQPAENNQQQSIKTTVKYTDNDGVVHVIPVDDSELADNKPFPTWVETIFRRVLGR